MVPLSHAQKNKWALLMPAVSSREIKTWVRGMAASMAGSSCGMFLFGTQRSVRVAKNGLRVKQPSRRAASFSFFFCTVCHPSEMNTICRAEEKKKKVTCRPAEAGQTGSAAVSDGQRWKSRRRNCDPVERKSASKSPRRLSTPLSSFLSSSTPLSPERRCFVWTARRALQRRDESAINLLSAHRLPHSEIVNGINWLCVLEVGIQPHKHTHTHTHTHTQTPQSGC